jgi:cob(I)alamin adenosyltransferase
MRIYTKKGDEGTTSLFRGGRVPKDDVRVSAYGDVDELSATIGVALAASPTDFERQILEDIQRDLFSIGALLATADHEEAEAASAKVVLDQSRMAALEAAIDSATEALSPLEQFVLPGGSSKAAALHHSRTVCRRAERSVVTLSHAEPFAHSVLPYLNRLSDLLFMLARLANQTAGIPDSEW